MDARAVNEISPRFTVTMDDWNLEGLHEIWQLAQNPWPDRSLRWRRVPTAP
jgi:hypothetical protein